MSKERQALALAFDMLTHIKNGGNYSTRKYYDNLAIVENALRDSMTGSRDDEDKEYNRQMCEDAQAEYDSQWPIYKMPQA